MRVNHLFFLGVSELQVFTLCVIYVIRGLYVMETKQRYSEQQIP
jgi:hypothetical protein